MKITTICENRIYARAYRKGKKYAGKYSVLYALKNGTDTARIGLTVTKARGTAVVRSRIKRVLRHAYYEVVNECGEPRGYDVIIVSRDAAAFAKSNVVAVDMKKGMLALGIVAQPNTEE